MSSYTGFMTRPVRNPFYIVLGIIGFTFTITAASYCLSVLRGIRPQATLEQKSHPLEELMDRHGTSLLTGQLIILAIATVGAVTVDHLNSQMSSQKKQNPAKPESLLGDTPKPDSSLETK
jgi:hypothetical protein